jgi:prepilin-type N-terminal cleavage/methylation domain-containing protein
MRRARTGFTLIELIVVVVVIGILAGIATAKFLRTKEAAYVASMQADLRNFALYEQNYLMDSKGTYFSGNGAAEGFTPTTGVSVAATALLGPPPSWSAIATHSRTTRTCQIVTDGPSIWDISCP